MSEGLTKEELVELVCSVEKEKDALFLENTNLKAEAVEKDKLIEALTTCNERLGEHCVELESALPVNPVTLSADEMRQVLLTQVRSLVHENGSVYNKQDQGVYCQINRPGVDGSLHVYVQVPEEFVLDQYTPPTE